MPEFYTPDGLEVEAAKTRFRKGLDLTDREIWILQNY